MHHAVPVGFGERVGDVAEDAHPVADGQKLALLHQLLAEREPVHVRHHVEEEPVGRARVIERQDVRMLQRRRDLDLPEGNRSLPQRRGQLLPQHLDRDLPVVLQVLGEVHCGHAALF